MSDWTAADMAGAIVLVAVIEVLLGLVIARVVMGGKDDGK
jgi:hypothetical protein